MRNQGFALPILIFGVIVVLGVVGMIVLTLNSTPKSNKPAQQQTLTPAKNTRPTSTTIATNKPKPKASSSTMPQFGKLDKVYRSETFTINHPTDWSVSANKNASTSGTLVTFIPNTDPKLQAKLIIQINKAEPGKLDAIKNALTALQYEASDVLIQTSEAKRFTGKLEVKPVPMYENAIVFQYGNEIYLMKSSYFSQQPNTELDKVFRAAISTMKLTK